MHRHSHFLFGVLSTERVSHFSFRVIVGFLHGSTIFDIGKSMIYTKDAVAIRACESEVFRPAE